MDIAAKAPQAINQVQRQSCLNCSLNFYYFALEKAALGTAFSNSFVLHGNKFYLFWAHTWTTRDRPPTKLSVNFMAILARPLLYLIIF